MNNQRFALITGGTKGIGAGVVRMLLHEGYDVLVTYSHDDLAAELFIQEMRESFPMSDVFLLKANQSDTLSVQRIVSEIKMRNLSIDCIVCNAGITLRKPIELITNEEWLNVMNANVNNNLFLIRDLLSLIKKGSRIIFVGSMMAIKPHATSLAYGVSKSATHALALNLVKVFEGTGTTVNVIAPGFVETEWQKSKPEAIRQSIYNKTAIKRFAAVEEIVDAVSFCLKNPFVNGSVIEVSGGYDFK